MFASLWRWLVGLFQRKPPKTVTAREAMEELRRRGAPADPVEWKRLRSQLSAQVFSAEGRERLWKKQRRTHPGDVVPLSMLREPSSHDLRALRELVESLAKGR